MSDPHLPAPRAFRDLVPWADPYIASLLHKLGCAESSEGPPRSDETRRSHLEADVPSALCRNERERPWRQDWMPPRWPRG